VLLAASLTVSLADMFRYVFVLFLTIAAAEPSCKGDHCAAHDGSTAGSVMLQVNSAKSVAKLNDVQGDEEDSEFQMAEGSDLEAETDEEIEEQDLEAIEADEEESSETTESGRSGKGNRRKVSKQTAEDKAACPAGGRTAKWQAGKTREAALPVPGCWHLAVPGSSCEETCVEKDMQYDESTDILQVAKDRVEGDNAGTQDEARRMCLGVAAKFGFPGKKEKMSSYGNKCGCSVYKIAAYGKGAEVSLGMAPTSPSCTVGVIQARLCACKKAAVIGDSCKVSSGCKNSYCKSGKCTTLVAQDKACTEHESCTTGYCSPTEGTCSTLAWKAPVRGAYARHYFKSGARKLQYRKVPEWAAMTTFPKGFCINFKNKTTGCLVASGIDQAKTIATAKQRCAQNAECRAIWCCRTGCPAATCYATKAEAPNYLAKDCPDAPGSFGESKYANSFFAKDEAAPPASEKPKPDEGEDDAPVPPAPEKDDKDTDKAEDSPKPPAPEEPENDADPEEPEEEEEVDAKIYKSVKSKAACRFGRGIKYTKLKGEKTVDECAEAVKQRKEGLGFAWLERKKLCLMAPKPWSECPKYRKGAWDLYELVPDARGKEEHDE